jgi:hypothetical protein
LGLPTVEPQLDYEILDLIRLGMQDRLLFEHHQSRLHSIYSSFYAENKHLEK